MIVIILLLSIFSATVQGMQGGSALRLFQAISAAIKSISKEPVKNCFDDPKLKLTEEDCKFLVAHAQAKAIKQKNKLIDQSSNDDISQQDFSMLTSQLDDLQVNIIECLESKRVNS